MVAPTTSTTTSTTTTVAASLITEAVGTLTPPAGPIDRDDLRARVTTALGTLEIAQQMLRDQRDVVDDGHHLGHIFDGPDGWRWDCSDCVVVSVGTYEGFGGAWDGLVRHHQALHARVEVDA